MTSRTSGPIRGPVLYLKALGAWFGFAALATVGSVVRTAVLLPALGEHRAHQAATLLTAAAIFLAILLFARVTALDTREAWRVAWLWVGCSLVAEFPLLHYGLGVPWARLFADYDVRRGRLFALVLIVELVGPRVAATSVGRRRRAGRA